MEFGYGGAVVSVGGKTRCRESGWAELSYSESADVSCRCRENHHLLSKYLL